MWLITVVLAASAPGFVEVEGGVAQEANVTESLGWRCDPDNPLKVTIEGKALMYVEVLSGRGARKLELQNGDRPVVLEAVPPFVKLPKPIAGYRMRTDFALDIPDGPQPYTFRCPRGSLVKLLSVEKINKKISTVR